ncbi:MAG: ABC-F family ATP-binding cassette domain-containing protein [Lachnospiraceae bacterium]|nr:ABC-F family ATP-binding cassette domain-containing protein [Lachnospiraceae bacterium]
MLLSIRNADVSYGGELILTDVSFDIRPGEKIAVVGRNGCGKTTLLKLITGELSPQPRDSDDQPMIARTGDPTIGCLSQMSFTDENAALGDELKSVFAPVLALKARMEQLLEQMKNGGDEKLAEEYAAAEERFSYLGGYRYEKDYEQLYRRFGFSPEEESRPLSDFSGGQRTKIAFIKLLLSRPDILLLDEPTNHLDISTIAWLEGYIAEYPRAVVVVSHDRLFLDRVAETVYEIERGRIRRYIGNYSDYMRRKKEDYEQQLIRYNAQQKEKERLEALAERFIHKATKASMAKSKLKAVEHMELIEKPEEADLKAFHAMSRPKRESGRDVLICENLGVGYNDILARVSLNLQRGRKLGIIGGNGLGKSTFLKTVAGRLPKKSGKFTFGYAVDIGYFEQQMAAVGSTKSVLNEFWDEYPTLTETEVRNILGGFLFSGDDVFKTVSEISGGERVRLSLAKLLQTGPNLLLLDEPTNHMDIVGKEALEEMLADYEGTLIFVSHDRYLIRRLAQELLIFTPEGAEYFPFGYEEYERHYGKEKLQAADQLWKIDGDAGAKEEKKVPAEKKGNPGKERAKAERRRDRLEQLLAENDTQREALEAEISDPQNASDYVKLTELQGKLDELSAKADEYMEEWEELDRVLSSD